MEKLETPYLESLKNALRVNKKMLECLEKRLILIHENYTSKSEYEKNEIEVTKIKTTSEIDALTKVINEKEKYFVTYMKLFEKELEECEKNFDALLEKAKKSTNVNVVPIINGTNFENINVEEKVYAYKRLKELLK